MRKHRHYHRLLLVCLVLFHPGVQPRHHVSLLHLVEASEESRMPPYSRTKRGNDDDEDEAGEGNCEGTCSYRDQREEEMKKRRDRKEQRQRTREQRRMKQEEAKQKERRETQFKTFEYRYEHHDQDGRKVVRVTDAFNTVFSTDRPRDLVEGMTSGVKNVVIGTAAGLVSVIGMPILGFQNGGIVGLIVGGFVGSVSGAIIAISGMVSGVCQVVWGAVRTPAAIHAARLGKIWNGDQHEWVFYYLDAEAAELESEATYQAARERNEKKKGRKQTLDRSVKDSEYYELLGIPTDATPAEIKRAYYRRARDVHPDKNPDDPTAVENFRKINAAYQTLSDEEKRAYYDTWGSSSVDENALNKEFDPYVFFAIMFGSDLVEPYIGELTIASVMDNIIKLGKIQGSVDDFFDIWSGSDVKARKRQVNIALHLRDRVGEYVNGTQSREEFRKSCQLEAQKIAETSYGPTFLIAIGSALRMEADEFLGFHASILGLSGPMYWARMKIYSLRKRIATIVAFHKTMRVIWTAYSESINEQNDEAAEGEKKGDRSKSDLNKQLFMERMEQSLPTILKMAWVYNVQDITITLREACRKLFADFGAQSAEERLNRAKAVRILGEEFLVAAAVDGTEGKIASWESDDIKVRAENAFRASVAKANGRT